jgi:hypothetical protein
VLRASVREKQQELDDLLAKKKLTRNGWHGYQRM